MIDRKKRIDRWRNIRKKNIYTYAHTHTHTHTHKKVTVTIIFWYHTGMIMFKTWCHKNKVVPVHTLKAYRGRRHTAPIIPNLGTRWSGQLHTLTVECPRKEPWHPLNTRLQGGLQSQSGQFWWRGKPPGPAMVIFGGHSVGIKIPSFQIASNEF